MNKLSPGAHKIKSMCFVINMFELISTCKFPFKYSKSVQNVKMIMVRKTNLNNFIDYVNSCKQTHS